LTKPQLYIPTKKEGGGATPTNFVCDEKPIQLKNLIKQIPDEQWKKSPIEKVKKGIYTNVKVFFGFFSGMR
jgi:hypothetical protein